MNPTGLTSAQQRQLRALRTQEHDAILRAAKALEARGMSPAAALQCARHDHESTSPLAAERANFEKGRHHVV